MTVQTDKLFCFGFGYVAERFSQHLLAEGATVYGTARSAEKAHKISVMHPKLYGTVFSSGDAIDPLPLQSAHWLISIPPDENGCPAFRAAQSCADTAASITYLSTTGVYGDHKGGWVYEDTPTSPLSDRAKRRAMAEQQWQALGANIVRLPGIYGPGRSAIDRLKAGKARRIIKRGQVFSRIHVADIASGLEAILTRQTGLRVFHLCDDEPAAPQDVITYAAELLGINPPPEIPVEGANLSAMGRSFYAECKRVSNAATKRALQWQPLYLNYRLGLSAILAAEQRS